MTAIPPGVMRVRQRHYSIPARVPCWAHDSVAAVWACQSCRVRILEHARRIEALIAAERAVKESCCTAATG